MSITSKPEIDSPYLSVSLKSIYAHSSTETDFKMGQVRVLENGDNSRVIVQQEVAVQQEVVENSDRDYGYDSVPEREATAVLLEDVRSIKELLLRSQDEREREEKKNVYLREWRVIACITDRIFFVVYVVINTVTIGVLFCGS